MKINIRNLGTIRDFNFELNKRLTIFCGPNNTGKTYAAYAIYSVLAGFSRLSPDWLSPSDFEVLLREGTISIDPPQKRDNGSFYDQINSAIKDSLEGDFDAPSGFFANAAVEINLPDQFLEEGGLVAKSQMRVGGYEFEYFFESNALSVVLAKKSSGEDDKEIQLHIVRTFLNRAISQLYSSIFLNRAFVLTAERSAINLFSRELSFSRNALVERLLALGEQEKRWVYQSKFLPEFVGRRAKRYSLPIRDGLETAEDLKSISKSQGEFSFLASRLEREVIGGEIKIDESGELIFSPQNGGGLRINMAASLVKSLSSLVVYLRHQSKKGDLLIIDEPEMNLHPDNQRKIAKFFCELVNSGVDVLMSTHSDYIIREINNSIVLKKPEMAEVRQRYSYAEEATLNHNDVSVLLFKADGLPVDVEVGELGFSIETIDDEINALNQISQDILEELSK